MSTENRQKFFATSRIGTALASLLPQWPAVVSGIVSAILRGFPLPAFAPLVLMTFYLARAGISGMFAARAGVPRLEAA
jgi:hypothetical protein